MKLICMLYNNYVNYMKNVHNFLIKSEIIKIKFLNSKMYTKYKNIIIMPNYPMYLHKISNIY